MLQIIKKYFAKNRVCFVKNVYLCNDLVYIMREKSNLHIIF